MKGELVILDGGSAFSKRLTELLAEAPDFAWDVCCPEGEEEEKALFDFEELAEDAPHRVFLFGNGKTAPGINRLPALFLSEKKEECGEESFRIYRYSAFSEIKAALVKKAALLGKKTVENLSRRAQEYSLRERLDCRLREALSDDEELSDDALTRMIREVLHEEEPENPLSEEDKNLQEKLLFASLRRFDVLSLALDDPDVTEVMINHFDRIFIEKEGRLTEYPHHFLSEDRLYDIVQRLAAQANRRINESAPMMDAVLKDGSRVNVVLPPVSPDGAVITVRRFPAERPGLAELVDMETLSREAADFLKTTVECGYNIFISGGTGAGKTTLLSALASVIPEEERVVTVEDCAELKIHGHPNLVRLEARPASTEGVPEISIRSLIKNALRMRPDRLIVGEIRSGEAFDMLQAMNTGHDGSLSTGHANSAPDMLVRIESMVQMGVTGFPLAAVRRQIASAIDLLVHMDRLRDRSRRVTGIYELRGMREEQIVLTPLYLFREEGEKDGKIIGRLFGTGETLENRAKLEKHGKRL